jgi:putative ABC transport system permease protein
MLMTIFGVTGSVALLFTGFGVQHSILESKDRQFGSIIKYDMIVAENMDTNTDKLYKMLEADDVKEYTKVYYDDASIQAGDKDDRSEVKVIIPETQKDFAKYIGLDHRETKTKIHLKDDGVVISERLAELLHVSKGDTFTYTENAFLVNLKNNSLHNNEKVSEKFMELDSVKGIVQNTTLTTLIDTIVKSLNKIMEVLILIATLLSIVILYNLTNINVCERIRELSTIKVLGFYENEVTMYIYRETILLSIIGIIVGWFVGMWLHHYILVTVPPEDVMFNPVRWIGAYIVPLVLIFVVLFILKFFINKKLKNVDMLEALKSVD